jgi:flavorubredoxin
VANHRNKQQEKVKGNTKMTTTASDKYAPVVPGIRQEPLKVTDDTYLIRSMSPDESAPVGVYLNSLVIRGREPVIVDTGTVGNRKQWLDDVFSLVDPKDVRWIYISHDDHDHTGNLTEVLELCQNATYVGSWFQRERLVGDYDLPLNRMRWVNDGEAFDAGDRLLVAIRPPLFDAPTTRGLYDSKSRVYWSVDSFATPVLKPTENVAELDPEFWAQGFATFASYVSPWHTMLDAKKFSAQVDRVAELELSAIVNAHSPIVSGKQIGEAIAMMRTLPNMEAVPYPDQSVLDAVLAQMTAGGAQ